MIFVKTLEGPAITVALVTSAAGDYFLKVFEGILTDSDVQTIAYFDDTRFWGSPDNVIVKDIETYEVGQPNG